MYIYYLYIEGVIRFLSPFRFISSEISDYYVLSDIGTGTYLQRRYPGTSMQFYLPTKQSRINHKKIAYESYTVTLVADEHSPLF